MELASLKDYGGLIPVQDRLQIISRFYEFDSSGRRTTVHFQLWSHKHGETVTFIGAPSIKHGTSVTRILSDVAAKAALDRRAPQLLQVRRSDNCNSTMIPVPDHDS